MSRKVLFASPLSFLYLDRIRSLNVVEARDFTHGRSVSDIAKNEAIGASSRCQAAVAIRNLFNLLSNLSRDMFRVVLLTAVGSRTDQALTNRKPSCLRASTRIRRRGGVADPGLCEAIRGRNCFDAASQGRVGRAWASYAPAFRRARHWRPVVMCGMLCGIRNDRPCANSKDATICCPRCHGLASFDNRNNGYS